MAKGPSPSPRSNPTTPASLRSRIEVYWPLMRKYYPGIVQKIVGELVTVLYDDGDKEELILKNEVWRYQTVEREHVKLVEEEGPSRSTGAGSQGVRQPGQVRPTAARGKGKSPAKKGRTFRRPSAGKNLPPGETSSALGKRTNPSKVAQAQASKKAKPQKKRQSNRKPAPVSATVRGDNATPELESTPTKAKEPEKAVTKDSDGAPAKEASKAGNNVSILTDKVESHVKSASASARKKSPVVVADGAGEPEEKIAQKVMQPTQESDLVAHASKAVATAVTLSPQKPSKAVRVPMTRNKSAVKRGTMRQTVTQKKILPRPAIKEMADQKRVDTSAPKTRKPQAGSSSSAAAPRTPTSNVQLARPIVSGVPLCGRDGPSPAFNAAASQNAIMGLADRKPKDLVKTVSEKLLERGNEAAQEVIEPFEDSITARLQAQSALISNLSEKVTSLTHQVSEVDERSKILRANVDNMESEAASRTEIEKLVCHSHSKYVEQLHEWRTVISDNMKKELRQIVMEEVDGIEEKMMSEFKKKSAEIFSKLFEGAVKSIEVKDIMEDSTRPSKNISTQSAHVRHIRNEDEPESLKGRILQGGRGKGRK